MIKSYEDIIRTVSAFRESRILLAGIELDIFTRLGEKSLSADELAQITNTVSGGLEMLLNALSGMGLLKKDTGCFSNTELSLKYLNTASSASIRNYLWLAAQMWKPWHNLIKALKGKTPKNKRMVNDHPELEKRFALAVKERSLKIIPKLLAHLSVGEAETLLDLGGGDGSYAYAMLEKYPHLRVTVFDRPSMIKAATLRAFNLGVITKINFKAGDFITGSFGGPYDIIFLSNIIHIFGPSDNRHLLAKTANSLDDKGRLIIVDAFLEDDRSQPCDTAVFSVELFLQTDSGRCYSWSEVLQWLAPLGFTGFKCTRIDEKIGILEAFLVPD